MAAATTAIVLHTVPAAEVSGSRPSTGVWASHDSGPMTSRIRPSETFRKARTTRGSNCVPAQRAISARPAFAEPASLYDRAEVITSKTSATATIRPASGIASPLRPRG